MPEPIDFNQLDRFLSGESSAEERESIARRASEDPKVRDLLEALPATLGGDDIEWDTEKAWQELKARRRRRPWWQLPSLAAAALLVIAVGIGVLQMGRAGDESASQSSVAAVEYRTARGEQRDIVLPDSSRIVLSAGSALKVPADYTANRAVYLEGEAFFEVRPEATRPFTAFTGATQTRVLGTSFNISAHPGGAVEVAVVTGRVQFKPNRDGGGEGAILGPGDAGRLAGNTDVVVRKVDVNDYIAWRQGRLVFRDVSLAEVTATLERWYDVDLVIADAALAQSRVSAFFERQNLNEVLDVLAETVGARYDRSGTNITFHRK